ncbi:MAG: hypothetical protein GX855_00615 [Firmicutes bacterium]|nr:hypothetical protein [Bacillota bacterium]
MRSLTPHTSRRCVGNFWEDAALEIERFIKFYNKPVVDDEPARDGTPDFGGIVGGTKPEQHMMHIRNVRQVGGHHIYHHDMFQMGYGHPTVPPTGIPDPEFSPIHRKVFEYLKIAAKYWENF